MKVLFVNGCIRAEKSRTLGIAENFLEAFSAAHQDVEIVTEDFNELRLEPLYHDTLEARDKAAGRCEWDNEMFRACAKVQGSGSCGDSGAVLGGDVSGCRAYIYRACVCYRTDV